MYSYGCLQPRYIAFYSNKFWSAPEIKILFAYYSSFDWRSSMCLILTAGAPLKNVIFHCFPTLSIVSERDLWNSVRKYWIRVNCIEFFWENNPNWNVFDSSKGIYSSHLKWDCDIIPWAKKILYLQIKHTRFYSDVGRRNHEWCQHSACFEASFDPVLFNMFM